VGIFFLDVSLKLCYNFKEYHRQESLAQVVYCTFKTREENKMGKIHFRGVPFVARVVGQGVIKCTPIVYEIDSSCGIGVLYEDSQKGQTWGLFSPRNIIAAWRGTEVLRHLDLIKDNTLATAYYAGLRDPHDSDKKRYVEPMILNIGRGVYDKIMRMPVPEEIIRVILDNQGDEFPPHLYPIAEEVRAGTIKWRKEFADVGIEHPYVSYAKKLLRHLPRWLLRLED